MVKKAKVNTPPPMQEQGVWPGCGQGETRWVGLTFKVNSNELHVGQKNMTKVQAFFYLVNPKILCYNHIPSDSLNQSSTSLLKIIVWFT